MSQEADVLNEINAVDWASLPGRPDWYEPTSALNGLCALASAASMLEVAEACSRLDSGGILHAHSGAVMPAAATAAHFLLDIAEHGPAVARQAALNLVEETLGSDPVAGYARMMTTYGDDVPLCCAIAHQVLVRQHVMERMGKPAAALLAEAAIHWRFTVDECISDGGDTVATGVLLGTPPRVNTSVEMHSGRAVTRIETAVLVDQSPEPDGDTYLRIIGVRPSDIPPRARLYRADCGNRLH